MAKIKWNGQGAIRIVTRSAKEGINEIMEEVKEKAVEYAPLDTGELRGSARLVVNEKSTVVFFDAPHARIQHENLEFSHTVGRAKFLEDAYNELMPRARRTIGEKISDSLKKSN